VAIDPMPSRFMNSARIVLVLFSLFAVLTVVISLSIDLSKFQEQAASSEDQAILQGIKTPAELDSALRQHPSSSVLQLMATATKVVDGTKAAIDKLSGQIEPAQLSKELNFASVGRDELDSFRRDLKTAEANAQAFLPRYAALFKTEYGQIESAAVSSHVPKQFARQLLEGVTQRQTKTLQAISLVLSARADYYRAYEKYIAFLSGELGSFKIVAGQFIFPLPRTVERYNAAAQAMTSAGGRVNELETGVKKLAQPIPEEWIRWTSAR
jgi:hypothetical protein